ncbi:MAG: hypothetical protein EBX50_01415 [Chitinophagia bacterium]|nr:hypothetical protein [Chitinophagia bacterium]
MTIKKISNKINISQIAKKRLSVGYFDGDKYPDGTQVAYVASIHEYGARNTPARPFFRPAIQNNQKKWESLFAKAIKNGASVNEAFDLVGNVAAGDVAEAIKNVSSPALNQKTIDKKGFSKPLVDTGKMLQGVTYEVTDA